MAFPTTIDCIEEAVRQEIEASTPSLEPSRCFVAYDGALDLEGKAAIQGAERQRFFTAHALADFQYGRWNGNVANTRQTITVTLRYKIDPQRGGIARARSMFASDNMLISGLITSARPSQRIRDVIVDARAVRNPRLTQRGQGVYTGRLDIFVQYFYRRR